MGGRSVDLWWVLAAVGQAVAGAGQSASLLVRQFQGSKVCGPCALVGPETTRHSTSVSQGVGSTPFSFAVWIKVIAVAQLCAPPFEPANKAFLCVKGHLGPRPGPSLGRSSRSLTGPLVLSDLPLDVMTDDEGALSADGVV